MAVIMIAEAPHPDASFIDGMRAAGVADTLAQPPGFVEPHQRRREQRVSRHRGVGVPGEHQTWYDDHVAPNISPGTGPIPLEYVDMLLASPES
jgi:hypothetical protein